MILRLLTPVALSVLLIFSLYIPNGIARSIERQSEINRLLRIELQHAKQVQTLLKLRSAESSDEETIQSKDVLKVSLIEKLLENSWPRGITNVDYEFQILPGMYLSYAGYPLEGVRVILNFTARHSLALISYLDLLMLSVYPQPIEIRACESRKSLVNGLRNQCVLDFYYWGQPNEQE